MAERKPRAGAAVLAVDGGNSKTDVVLTDRAGNVLAARRVGRSSNLGLGMEGSMDVLEEIIRAASTGLGISPDGRPIANTGVYCLAGADLPVDERRIGRDLLKRGWTSKNILRNDTFAVLRAGTDRGWGVGLVVGTGMNCSGIAPDGRVVRFPALGELSGDFAAGGGYLGPMALAAAIRGRDGRGPRTLLERLVPEHFGMSRPAAVMEATYVGRLSIDRLARELPPIVFAAAAEGDRVAREILDRVADEAVLMVAATIRRLRLTSRDVHVILGGGVFRSRDPVFSARIRAGIEAVAPRAVIRTLHAPPVLGAALIGLDAIRAPTAARARLLRTLTPARLAER